LSCPLASIFKIYSLTGLLLLWAASISAQTGTNTPGNPANQPKKDTSMNKTNNNKWKNEGSHTTYTKQDGVESFRVDTSIHFFYRLGYLADWTRDMGNIGGPAQNLFYTPENRFGPNLGYHVFDAGAYNIDSLNYYSTNHPFTDFSYRLGSKLEQYLGILHTQNIKPNWNFAFEYHKTTSAGFYKIQRNNNDNFFFTTNYKSLDKHYELKFGLVYNKEQHDENGGITNERALDSVDQTGAKVYSDRKTIDVVNQHDGYSMTRSPVFNNMRQMTMRLQHSYMWGQTDTTYSEDSTQYSFKLKPRWRLTHTFELSTQKHTYEDLTPDSLRYATLFHHTFLGAGGGYYVAGQDSVNTVQKWVYLDNKVALNCFLGNVDNPAIIGAGLGSRYDVFTSTPVSNFLKDSLSYKLYTYGQDRTSMVNNYLYGVIKKPALSPSAWQYQAEAQLFFTGEEKGKFKLDAALGKNVKDIGALVIGFSQQINTSPYSYTNYENAFTKDSFNLSKDEIINSVYGRLTIPGLKLSCGVSNYIITNYIYTREYTDANLNVDSIKPQQYTIPITIQQAWIRKIFRFGSFILDNQLAYQMANQNAPVNLPLLMGRHQLSYEGALFKKAMAVAIGLDVRYNTAYKPSGYDFLLNRFFYQNNTSISNMPEVAFFINFKVKNKFRAFIMADQLQQIIPGVTNTLLYVGMPVASPYNTSSNLVPVYAMPNAMMRMGFSWYLVN